MKRCETKTKRLIIRKLKPSDYNAWFDAYVNNLPAKSKWDSGPLSPKSCTKSIFKAVIKKQEKLAKEDKYYRYYVFNKKTNEIIGQIDFDIFKRSTHQFANYGYFIFNRHWNKGYGTEAVKAGLKIGFDELKLHRLEAAINLDNKKSIALVKKIGMKREGIKKRYWFENNQWTDHLIYVANPEDFNL